jgi:hypothetical protein
LSSNATTADVVNAINQLDTKLAYLDRHLRAIADENRILIFDNQRRIPIPNGSWTQPGIPVPKQARMIFIQQIPQTATVKIQFGESENIQEQAQPQNYETLPPSSLGRWYRGKLKGTIYANSDTSSTYLEITTWI